MKDLQQTMIKPVRVMQAFFFKFISGPQEELPHFDSIWGLTVVANDQKTISGTSQRAQYHFTLAE